MAVPDHVIEALYRIVGEENVITAPEELLVYECDGFTIEKIIPEAVVFPSSKDELIEIVKLLGHHKIPFTPRGAGTGLSGGCLTPNGGVSITLTKLNHILDIDIKNRCITAETGVVNEALSVAVEKEGYYFAPDPSSQIVCTIGGNVAENAGGPHCLKYGATNRHILGMEAVMPDGKVVKFGGKAEDLPGYDLTSLMIGSEGLFGIVTEVICRLTHLPEIHKTLLIIFDTMDLAVQSVADVIARGIIPGAMEVIDNNIIDALEEAFHFGLPRDAGTIILMELDGLAAGMDTQVNYVREICQKNGMKEIRIAKDEAERTALWQVRKKAFGAVGRISPNYFNQDGTVPRTKLLEMLRFISSIGERYNLRIANVFHAGDGNIHPCIFYDERDSDQMQRMLKASDEIVMECIRLGGAVSGEHGIGCEKKKFMRYYFTPADFNQMKKAHDVFNKEGLLNPGKVFPDTSPEE